MRLIDADALIKHKFANPISYNAFVNLVKRQQTIQPEVTEEAVKEYCRKRCLCIVDSALLKKYASAQPERKKGKWIVSRLPVTGGLELKCSNCDEALYMAFAMLYNFCPNCGADMRGEE